jgi:hypothetical protein
MNLFEREILPNRNGFLESFRLILANNKATWSDGRRKRLFHP